MFKPSIFPLLCIGYIYYRKCLRSVKEEYLNNPNKVFQYTVKNESDVLLVVREIIPQWHQYEMLQIELLQGGITNKLYKVRFEHASVIVRIYGDHTEHFIHRERDNVVFAKLSKLEYGPVYYGCFRNGRIEGFIEKSITLTPKLMVEKSKLIAFEMAKFHQLQVDLKNKDIGIWDEIGKFRNQAKDIMFNDELKNEQLAALHFHLMDKNVEDLKTKLPSSINENGYDLVTCVDDDIEKQAYQFAMEIVFCHNDVLCGNILLVQDTVRFIDYEYGCYNCRGYDIANHLNEYVGFECNYEQNFPNQQQIKTFCTHYLYKGNPFLYHQLLKNKQLDIFMQYFTKIVCKFVLLSHLYWAFWSIVQSKYSKIDFDFLQYAKLRYQGYTLQKTIYS